MSNESSNEPSPLAADLLARARRAPHHRLGIRELAEGSPARLLIEALDAALDGAAERASLALALALAGGATLPTRSLARLLPDVEDPAMVAFLLGGASGDRLEMLGQLFDEEVLTREAEAMLLWLATEKLGLASPLGGPWLVRIRQMARRTEEPEDAAAFLGTALTRFSEEVVRVIGEQAIVRARELASLQDEQGLEVLRYFSGSLDDVLEDEEAPRLLATVTMKSQKPKVGRNDLCPCGSGKKYKKCHEGKDDPEQRGTNAAIDPAALSAVDLGYLRVAELAALDVARMKNATLQAALDRAVTYRRWALAERCAEALEREHHDELAMVTVALGALDCRRWDIADRLMARWSEADLPEELRIHQTLAQAASVLGPLSELGAAMMADPKAPLFELAVGLLHRAPGLGVPVARGLIPDLAIEDGDTMVEEIERARDVLGLPPGDPAIALIEALDEEDHRAARFELASKEVNDERDRLRAAVARKDEELSARLAEVMSLSMRLEEAEDEVVRVQAQVPDPSSKRPAPLPADAERKKLSAKIEELKALVHEGNKERAGLRRQITDLSEELEVRSEAAPASANDDPIDEGTPLDEPNSPRVPVVPIFSRAARDSLGGFPHRIKRQAIELSASLASGEASAWRNVKQMEGVQKVWSARLGIHNRLLFRVHDEHLEILDVVTREDLLKVLERWR